MDADPADPPRLDELVARLRAKVEERRRAGEYPPGLEQDMAAHFQRIAAHRVVPDFEVVRAQLADLDVRMGFSADRVRLHSRVPGGEALHRVVSMAVARQTQGILEQLQEFADGVRAVLRSVVGALEDPYGHFHADLVGQLDAVLERLASYERGPADAVAAIGDLRRRVEQLEAAERRRDFRAWFGDGRFEEEFRGSREELLERYRDVALRFRDLTPVLDLGCGRGEFLELLAEQDVEASGVELDPGLVKFCTERGLDVQHGDALEVLEHVEDESLGGIVMLQVIEHLSQQDILRVVALGAAKLRPGGLMFVETVNPQSLYVYAHSFYLDPTHTRPVHPAYLMFLFREAGFGHVAVDWRSPPPEDDALAEPEGEGEGVHAENVRRLNRLLFAPQDYAVVATR